MRVLNYCQAINEALTQEMGRDPSVFVYGIGTPDHVGIFGSVLGLKDKYGAHRVVDTPLCEDAMTGFGLGAAFAGLRPVHCHIRVDFLILAMNQLANMISSFHYATNGKTPIPLVIRAVVGRGWGQGYQHSKSLHSIFAHIPGLKVVLPTTPRDAKGLLISAIRDNNPVLMLEHRWLYWAEGDVPEEPYAIPLGEPNVLREGKDITIIANSWMCVEALSAAKILESAGVSVEVVDPRTIAPLQDEALIRSVKKTKRCLVAEHDWVDYGFTAEIAARISSACFGELKGPVERVGFAHTPCPTVRVLENEFYPNAKTLVRRVEKMMGLKPINLDSEDFFSNERRFKGPF